MTYLLTIDNGTQSVRALLFDPQGTLLAKSQLKIQPYFSHQPGWAEQEPDYFWKKVGEACRQLWRSTEIAPQAVSGVAVTTQRGTVINVDQAGRPLRPAISWLDQRRTDGLPPVGGLWGVAFKGIRMSDTIAYFQAEAEANWIAHHQPDVWRSTHKYLLLSGYLNYKLTGRFVDSIGSQVAYIPFDYKNLRWARSWDWKWRVLDQMRPRLLPELYPPGARLGSVTQEAADVTGLPVGLPVIAAAADKACEVLGAGGLLPEIGSLSLGTTATFNVTSRRYREVLRFIPPYPAAVPDAYSLEVQIFRGFWMVSWFKEEFGLQERQAAEELGVPPEALLEELIGQVPAGSMGLMLQPYWSPGLKVPEAKGAVIGFGDVHTRAHFYRAMLEGIAYELRSGMERTEKVTGVPIRELRVSGGGSQSDAVMQLTADIFGKPALRPHTYETSGLGAAIDLAVGLGVHADFPTAVDAMTRVGQSFEPDRATHRLYNDLYHRVYLKIFPQLQQLYAEIREITGYPG